jgi:hypothetical protein
MITFFVHEDEPLTGRSDAILLRLNDKRHVANRILLNRNTAMATASDSVVIVSAPDGVRLLPSRCPDFEYLHRRLLDANCRAAGVHTIGGALF